MEWSHFLLGLFQIHPAYSHKTPSTVWTGVCCSHEVCAEGWEDSWVAKHLDVVHFQNVWSSPGKGHFPVSVGQLNSWVRAIKISLFKAKKKKKKLTWQSYHLVKNINTSQILVTNENFIHSDILHLLFKEECEAVVMLFIDRVVKIAIISIVLLGRYTR